MHDGAMVEWHVLVDELAESIQFLFIRQIAREEQVGDFLESETLFLEQWFYEIIQFIATIIEFSLCGLRFTLFVNLITQYISNVGQSHENSASIFVAKSSLHAIFLKEFVVDLARVLNLVAQFVN